MEPKIEKPKKPSRLSPKGSHRAVLFLFMIIGLCIGILVTGKTLVQQDLLVLVFAAAILLTVYDIIRAVTAKPIERQPLGIGIGKVRLTMHLAFVVLFLLYWVFYGFNFWLLMLAFYGLLTYTFMRLVIDMKASR
ncbi:MAG: hypothetical protein N2V78_09250 [Methanophagales archaeon]|nr:hypothetical protein [Methanophagales archaeon]